MTIVSLYDTAVRLPGTGQLPEVHDVQRLIERAIHNYFSYRRRLNQLELKRLMKQGRTSLLVGLSFLLACLGTIELFTLKQPGALHGFISEGLTIAGWVAMWKPMEIYLYDWWPLRRRGQVFDKLSRMPVEVRKRDSRFLVPALGSRSKKRCVSDKRCGALRAAAI